MGVWWGGHGPLGPTDRCTFPTGLSRHGEASGGRKAVVRVDLFHCPAGHSTAVPEEQRRLTISVETAQGGEFSTLMYQGQQRALVVWP